MIPALHRARAPWRGALRTLAPALAVCAMAAACAPVATSSSPSPAAWATAGPPTPDPRVGLRAGLTDAGEAIWNLRHLSLAPTPRPFVGHMNSDLAFTGTHAIQGNYYGFMIWDLADPSRPELVREYVCPGAQGDVSVYGNLLFVSVEGFEGRLDCGTQAPRAAVSAERIRGIRIFDISNLREPRYIANVQTCRGSHTHTLLEHPGDRENVYVYVSGSAPVRPEAELAGCVSADPTDDPASALFRIEVIQVPLAAPERSAIVSSPRIFEGLTAPPQHGLTPADRAEMEAARKRGEFAIELMGEVLVIPAEFARVHLDSITRARGGTRPTPADTARLHEALPGIVMGLMGMDEDGGAPNQCHDITVYPAIGMAGGACEGYGLLLDIRNPTDPRRLAAVADSNFAYWHSATFSNDGSKVLFTDEWGGGGGAKCRESDPMEWGANAIFSVEGSDLRFRSYWKLPAPQTETENCVAHNGSLVPIPGRDVMVQGWYQGGITLFDWTDPDNVVEIAFHDRGPVSDRQIMSGGSWSVYWYNGLIVSSEIARGLDVFELVPSAFLTQNEIDASRTVRMAEFNAQGQPRFEWPATFVLARAYADQLERSGGLSPARLAALRGALDGAESVSGAARSEALTRLAAELEGEAARSRDCAKVRTLAGTLRTLADAR